MKGGWLLKVSWPLRTAIALFLVFTQLTSGIPLSFARLPEISPISQLQIPAEAGFVEETFEGKDARRGVILIKDAHGVPDAQQSIARILSHLSEESGITWVGVEGAAGDFQTALFQSFPDQGELKKELSDLILRGELSGAVFSALTSRQKVSYEGIEEPELYQKNLNAYLSALEEKPRHLAELEGLLEQIKTLQKKHYSPEAQRWADIKESLRQRNELSHAWTAGLQVIADAVPFFSKKYPHLDAAWNQLQLDRAKQRLWHLRLREWKEVLEEKYPELKRNVTWNEKKQAWMTGVLSDAAYAAEVKKVLTAYEREKVPAEMFELAAWGQRLNQAQASVWSSEWTAAQKEADQAVFKSENEKDIAALADAVWRLVDCARTELVSEDWEALNKNQKLADAEMGPQIKQLAAKIDEAKKALLRTKSFFFYEKAVEREAVFENRLHRALKQGGHARAAMIVGGFHAGRLAESLRAQKISFAVVSPDIKKISHDDHYEKLMRGDVSWKDFFKIENGRIKIYESFAAAMIYRLLDLERQKREPEKVLKNFSAWRENLIRNNLFFDRVQSGPSALEQLDFEVLSALYKAFFDREYAQALTRVAANKELPAQNLFDVSSRMTNQPWVTVPLGGMTALPGGAELAAGRTAEARSEMRVLPREATISNEELAELWGAALEDDGSLVKTVETMRELKELTDQVAEHLYVVTMDKEKAVQKFSHLDEPIKVRIYPRQVEAKSFKEAAAVLMERQIRAGRAVELPDGNIEWQPFMRIIETGEIVTYVVYKDGKLVKNKGKPFFTGSIPARIQKSADYIFILNAARAKRPGSHSGAPTAPVEHPSDDPATDIPPGKIVIAPENIKANILDEMYFWIEGREGQRWMVVENQFSALPPTMDSDYEKQPQMLVMTREAETDRRSYAQNWMHRASNLRDVFEAHAEFEGVSSEWRKNYHELSEAVSFAMGAIFNKAKPDAYNMIITGMKTDHVFAVNGYHPPNTPHTVHGGASQLHGHAQHVNFHIPLKNVPAEALTPQGEILIGDKKAALSTMNWGGEKALVIDYGDQRIFVFSRPNGKAEGFDNIWSFLELARAIIVDAPERVFADPVTREEINPGLLTDAERAFASTQTPLTASGEEMIGLTADLKDLPRLKSFLNQTPALKRPDQLFSSLAFSATDAARLFSPEIPKFDWKLEQGGKSLLTSDKFPGGISALVMQFRELAKWGREAERGQIAMRALRFHASRGDIFRYLKDWVKIGGQSLKPFSEKISELGLIAERNLAQAASASQERKNEYFEKALAANYEALELVDQLGDWIAAETLDYYLGEPDGPGLQWVQDNLISNRNLRKYMSRILSRRVNVAFASDVEGIHAYHIEQAGKHFVLALNVGAIPTPAPQDPEMKARGKIVPEGNFETFLKDLSAQGNTGYSLTDGKSGKKKAGPFSFDQELPLDIKEPEGIQFLEIKPSGAGLAKLIAAPARSWNVRAQRAAIEDALGDPALLRRMFEEIVSVSPEDARSRFGRKTPVIMALVAGVQPHLLDRVRDWNPFAYASLKRIMAQKPELFSAESILTFHDPDRAGTMVFSRTLPGNNENLANGDNGKNIIFALQFEEDTVNPHDGKVWSIVRNLGSEEKPIALGRTRFYQIRNLLDPNQVVYEAVRSGAELMRHWDVGIPVMNQGAAHRKDQHDWGFDLYQIIPTIPGASENNAGTISREAPLIPELMLAVNLMDVGAEIVTPDGKIIYFDSFKKVKDMLQAFRAMGYGKIYFYGGLFQMGEISFKLHGVSGDQDTYVVDDEAFPRTVIRGGYGVKSDRVLADNQGNSFSPVSMQALNPTLSDHRAAGGFSAGSSNQTQQQFRELAEEAHSLGIKIVADFIPWMAPEGVTEENYQMFFYKELPDGFTENQYGKPFHQLDEKTKQDVMKGLLKRNSGFFVKRFGEPGHERIVLIRHMYNEPGVDQAMLNPFHPLAKQYYLDSLKQRVDEGAEEVRVDLAHKLLNSNLKFVFEAWVRDGWQVGEGGEYRAKEEPFGEVILKAKQYAAEQGKRLEFDMEAYDFGIDHVAVHQKLQKIGADRAYFVPVHQAYRDIAKGNLDARDLRRLLQIALDLKIGKLEGNSVPALLEMIFLSNYDEPSLNQMGGPKRAAWMVLLAMAKAGVPVLQDFRDVLDHYGQFIPIPGEHHPFPSAAERERRADFEGLKYELQRSPAAQIAREFAALEPSQEEIKISFLDNEKDYQFAALNWRTGEGEKILVLNIRPHENHTVWIEAPKETNGMQAEDVLTGERFEVKDGRIQSLNMPTTLPYRALKIVPVQRSEVRSQAAAAIDSAAREISGQYPRHFVPRAIVAGNDAASMRSEQRSAEMIKEMISGLEGYAARHFAQSNTPLHLGFVMAYEEAAAEDMLALAEKIQQLKLKYGGKIINRLFVFIPFSETERTEAFVRKMNALGAGAKYASEANELIRQLNKQQVFAYGLPNPENLPEGLRHLAVESDYSMRDIFAAALALNLGTAAEIKLTAELVLNIPNQYQGLFGFNPQRRALTVLNGIFDAFRLEAITRQLFASAA